MTLISSQPALARLAQRFCKAHAAALQKEPDFLKPLPFFLKPRAGLLARKGETVGNRKSDGKGVSS